MEPVHEEPTEEPKPKRFFLLRKVAWNFRSKLFCFCAAAGLSFPIWKGLMFIGHVGPPAGCIQPDLLVLAQLSGAAILPFVSLSLIKLEPILAAIGILLAAAAAVALFVIPFPY
jgi:hypothetical protein